jgi:L-ascorbate metabolism protein UlaG (beta-lactamase superfamily)
MQSLMLAVLLAAAPAPAPVATAAATGDGHTHLTWYGHATFSITTPKGLVLVIDPWFGNPKAVDKDALAKLGKVDYLLVSHGHFDHVADAVTLGQRGAKLIASFELGNDLVAAGYPKDQATMETLANAGGTLALGDEVKVSLVPAVHSSGFNPPGSNGVAEYGGNPLGFVIQIQGGPTIYHTGDTDAFYDMKDRIGDRFKVDVMLACIGGHFTMDPEGAALAASYVKPKWIVPMHYGTFPILTGTPEELGKALKAHHAKAKMLELKVGEPKIL